MSVRNSLKKPTFTKSVMGYAPAEVDRYIDHINERYDTVSREAAELKRRIIALQVRLDEAEAKLDENEKNTVTSKVLDRDAIMELFSVLDRENRRHGEFVDIMKDKLSDMLAEETETEEDPDGEWTELLDGFIELPTDEEHAEEKPAVPEVPYRAVFAPVEDVAPVTPSAPVADEPADGRYVPRWLTEMSDELPHEQQFAAHEEKEEMCDVTGSAPAADTAREASADEAPAAFVAEDAGLDCGNKPDSPAKSAAETLAELDFYQDDVHRDGESFDPMTLAAQSTAKRSRPSLEDFFRAQNEK